MSGSNPLLEAALQRARAGARVVPLHSTDERGACDCPTKGGCKSAGKHPRLQNGAKGASSDPAMIERWWSMWPDANVGVVDGFVRLDIDAADVAALLLEDQALPFEHDLVQTRRGIHITVKASGCRTAKLHLADGRVIGDVKAAPGYVLVPPSRIGTHTYTRMSPEWVEPAVVDDPVAWLRERLAPAGHALADTREEPAYRNMGAQVREGSRHDALTSWAGKIFVDGMDDAAFAALLHTMNRETCDPPLPDGEVEAIAEHFLQHRERRVEGRLVMGDHARVSGERTSDSFPRTDAGNAELFARQYGDRLRFDHRRQRWLVWSGHRWSLDADAEVVRLAILASRHRGLAAVRIADFEERKAEAKFAIASENGSRLDAMIKIARGQPPLSDAGDLWDADGWMLGVANGVVDLRTGALRDGRADDRLTLFTDIVYEPEAEAPRWTQFLDEIFGGDEEMVEFIRRAVGYSLTGETREQCMFLCQGTGANGKSVFLAVLQKLAGQYAFNAPFSSFERQQQSSIPNDLAALVGKRVVTSSETNEGTRLNEARIKALTGCDPITARFLHAEFFTFTPVGKYWLAVNHKPVVGDDSVGFWRRVRLIPFLQQFRGSADDKTLQAKLNDELPGILAWAVRGVIAWQAAGLPVPDAVREATDSYREESDPLAQFIDDRCVVGAGLSAGANELYKAYRAWAEDARLAARETLTNKVFGSRMTMKFERRRSKRGNVYVGIDLTVAGAGAVEGLETAVEGVGSGPWVYGRESGDQKIEVISRGNALTRKNPELPYTTLHPYTRTESPAPAETTPETMIVSRCRRCGTARDLLSSNLCGDCRRASLADVMRGQT